MHKLLYPRLAAVNLRKNRQTWLPYLFTCTGTIMMFYIMMTLQGDPSLSNMSGGTVLASTLAFGSIIIGVFSVILVFYANSFIVKQRKREFGLYNILGMDKRHIGRVLFWETLYTALISFVSGIALGILFSKLMQLALLRILRFDVRFGMYVSPVAITVTAILFACIFVLTLLNSLRIIHLAKPVELLHGTQEGEREPKSKWLLAVLGVICLGIGYALAIMTKSAVSALTMFFVAVLFVIAGTYLLFTAFSIVFLKRMRANKNYYYKTRHFATVSGMLYRMKKNAGGLASICILSTMVLVTVSTTVCLYIGVDGMLKDRYPTDISVSVSPVPDANSRADIKKAALGAAASSGLAVSGERDYQYLSFACVRDGSSFTPRNFSEASLSSDLCTFSIITAADYNAMTGQNVSLAPGEVLLYTPNFTKGAFTGSKMTFTGLNYGVTTISTFPIEQSEVYLSWEVYCMVVSDESALKLIDDAQTKVYGEGASSISYKIDFNADGENDEKIACAKAVSAAASAETKNLGKDYSSSTDSRAANYEDFLTLYGGLLFLGLFLGLLFLMATVLIIYYKQVTEGYDDRDRFRIMQNVGMTKSEVKSTIHSQVLIVFFLPLAATIVHVAFAFPMIRRILSLFGLSSIWLFIWCTLAAIGIFAVLYTLVYSLTAKAYYRIVS